MKTLAAILVETGRPLEVAELEIPTLKPGQALVQIHYSGVCHTQLLESRGRRGQDRFLPHCLGHEGCGIVLECGSGVKKIKKDDVVILSWMKGSGIDVSNTKYSWNGRDVNAGAITTFSHYSVISENRLTPISAKVPEPFTSLLGCAIPTGMGAVLNTAEAKAGQSTVIFGLGGIGMCALAASVLSQEKPIIAVDLSAERLKLAHAMGATHTIQANETDVSKELQRLCPEGLDIAIEATGQPAVMRLALQCVRSQGGKCVIVGNAPEGSTLEIDPKQLNMGKRLLGTWGGDNQPDVDFPRYAKLLKEKKVPLEALTQSRYPLESINQALDDLETGRTLRPLIAMRK